MSKNGGDFARLQRALEVFEAWEEDPARPSAAELLTEHEALREVLEPLLEHATNGREPPGAPAALRPTAPGDAAAPPPELGGFRIERELGRGGMGVVYLARQVALDRQVALKVLPGDARVEPRAVARFRRESALLAALDHPSLVEVLTVGREHGFEFFAMELVDGVPLDQVLRDLGARGADGLDGASLHGSVTHLAGRRGHPADAAPAPTGDAGTATASRWHRTYFEAAARLTFQVADALEHAHRAGVLHRDVKASNILVRADGRAVLTDFGLAREVGRPSLTQSGEFAGTPYYAAPEQVLGRARDLDGRTDVFALGVVLYQLLTLRRPFEGATSHEVAQAVLTVEPVDPQTHNPRVPADLAAIVLRALEKDARRRYQSAGELAAELDAFVHHRPVRARRAGPLRRVQRYVRREPWKAALAIVLVLLIPSIGFLGGYLLARGPVIAAGEAELRAAEVDDLLERATMQLEHGLPRAHALLARAHDLDPGHPDTIGVRTLALANQRGAAAALASLDGLEPCDRLPPRATTRLRCALLRRLERGDEADRIEAGFATPTHVVEAFYAGLAALDRGHATDDRAAYRAAVEHFELAVLLSERRRAVYLLHLAHAIGHAGDAVRAPQVAAAVVELWPDAVVGQWWSYFAERETAHERALPRLARAVELDPDNARLQYNLGVGESGRGRYDAARARFARATELDPGYAEAYANLSFTQLRTARYADALASIDRAVELDRDNAMFHANRGQALAMLKRLDDAHAALTRALELDPTEPTALSGMARLRWVQGGPSACAAFCKEQLQAGRRANALYRFLASATYELEGKAAALAVVLAGLERHPDNGDLHVQHAELLRRDAPEEAVAAARRAAAASPRNAKAWNLLVELLSGAGDVAGALDAQRRYAALEPRDPLGPTNLAILLARRGDRDEALATMRGVVDRFPEWPRGHRELADLLDDAGRTADAVAALEAGRARLPDDASLQLRLASALHRLATQHLADGEPGAARAAAARGLEALGDRDDAEAAAVRALLRSARDA